MFTFTERVSTSDDSAIKIQNLPSLITSSHLNQDREFFGYADVKIFAYFLVACIIVTISTEVFRMAVQKRLALTISPDYLELLHKVSAYQNIPTSTFVMGLLEGQRPVVEAMLKAFQDIEAGKEKEKVMQIFLADAFEAVSKEIRKD